jgi:hypothetical protein
MAVVMGRKLCEIVRQPCSRQVLKQRRDGALVQHSCWEGDLPWKAGSGLHLAARLGDVEETCSALQIGIG